MAKESIGGLWRKHSEKCPEFFSGSIKQMNGQELQIVIFPNDKGDNPNRPDYRIFLSEPREARQAPPNDEIAF